MELPQRGHHSTAQANGLGIVDENRYSAPNGRNSVRVTAFQRTVVPFYDLPPE